MTRAESILVARHDLWIIRMSSKSAMWRAIAPAVRAGLDDAATVRHAYFQLHRLESLAYEILERWPHREAEVIAALVRGARRV